MSGDRPIIGVDFSGARSDSATWVTQGWLRSDRLELKSCAAMTRSELAGLLVSLPANAVAALDFPFSVPQGFAAFWQPEAAAMPELWQAASAMDFGDFLSLRDRFVAREGEPLRRGDLYFPECYSCLHKFNPNMVPMTFRGMQLLDRLWAAGCRVPPLPDAGPNTGSDTGPDTGQGTGTKNGPLLLESMPGAALRAYGLPFKGYKNGANAAALRKKVLDGLESGSGVAVTNLRSFRQACLESHDCLDSVAAAVTAVLWCRDPGLFRRPEDDNAGSALDEAPDAGRRRRASPQALEWSELQAACLEGWLYAPVFLRRNPPP